MTDTTTPPISPRTWSVTLVLLAAAGTFALTMGARQTMGLFLGSLNTSTGLGLDGSVSGEAEDGQSRDTANAFALRIKKETE